MENSTPYLDMLLDQYKAENNRSVNLNLDEELVKEIDETVEDIRRNSERFCSRNSFIEVAAREYLSKIKSETDRLNFIKGKANQPDQVIIFTCNNHGGEYDSWYQASDYWSAVLLGKDVVNLIRNGNIKYFALYRSKIKGGGGQHIAEYSEIKSINYITSGPDRGKYEFFLNNRRQLPKPIVIGNVNPVSLMRGRRTTLQKFLSASKIADL